MKSMTAFSRREVSESWGSLNLEMRTVNHRYLDVNMRIGEEIRFFEPQIRQMIGESLSRGRVDLVIKFNSTNSGESVLNQSAVDQLINYQESLTKLNPAIAPLSSHEILQWPGVLEMALSDEKTMAATLTQLMEDALNEIQAQRLVEGEKIKQLLSDRTTQIGSHVDNVQQILPEVTTKFRENFEEKLSQMEVDIDSHRLEQELTIFLGKQDIAEELDRLVVHIEQVKSVLDTRESCGRRLDFLMQELNREVNTLTSKSVDIRLNNAAVDMKVFIEQMREQVQNIE